MQFELGIAQTKHPSNGDVVGLAAKMAKRAKHAGVDILVFPESLMTPYETDPDDFARLSQPLDGEFCTAVNGISRSNSIWILYTANEFNPHGMPYNTAVLADAEGVVRSTYRKIHLFDAGKNRESSKMSAGSQIAPVVQTPFGKLGIGICYDLRFPEMARKLALQGCEIMLYPAAWVAGHSKKIQWETLLAARAIENGMFVAGVSRCDRGYIGNSCVFAPDGRLVAQAGSDEELLHCTIDTSEVEKLRTYMPTLAHRRPELY